MTNVHDIIIRILDGHNLSTRRMALMSGIPPTTLESALERKSDKIRKSMLSGIAQTFGMPWYALMTTASNPPPLMQGKNPHLIPCNQIDDEEAEKIIAHFLSLPTPELGHSNKGRYNSVTEVHAAARDISGDEHLRQSILFVLHKLNSDGLMEVMSQAITLTKDPAYAKKEVPPCDSNTPT